MLKNITTTKWYHTTLINQNVIEVQYTWLEDPIRINFTKDNLIRINLLMQINQELLELIIGVILK